MELVAFVPRPPLAVVYNAVREDLGTGLAIMCCVIVATVFPEIMISSFSCRTDEKVDATVVKHIVQQHQRRVITSQDNEDVQRCHIRRSHVFSDALRQFSKRSFDVSKMIQVQFIGEQAVDEGGPRREFFHLLTHDIFKSSLFVGFPNHVVPVHNVKAVTDSTYHTVGKMIATCIIQGGEAPACFASAVADYLVYDRIRSPVCLEDISDYEVRNCLQKVHFVVWGMQKGSLVTCTCCQISTQ